MDQERAWKAPALNIEEAALLPALTGHADGGAALQVVRRDAIKMEEKQVSNTVMTGTDARNKGQSDQAPPVRVFLGRAALHHALTRRQRGRGRT